MAEDTNDGIEMDEEFEAGQAAELDHVIKVSGMYEEWFLDYASYVILERAVPHINDGLKPVQRRILHSLDEMDDGRYHKVANVIGNTMKFHPHGDASIGDAMVQIGQKDLLLDCQGNWGNIYTGDRAAAPRYIEVRLSKFGNEVVFNHKTTDWQASYDGRGKEPITLPVKFPLLLAQGVEGIAVGLSCKLLPHNFIELIDNSIKYLQGKRIKILPDFPTGGSADFSNYNDGIRGGKIRVRAKIEKVDSKTLRVDEIPFGTTTTSLIDSILKANDKGKIKIKKIEDNTAENVEIMIYLAPGVSPDKTIDALYAFSDCEVSISPNAVVIENDKPRFITVSEILSVNTENTRSLLKLELEIKRNELETQLHNASLEKIFIEEKIYIDFDGKTYEEAIEITFQRLEPFKKNFIREITQEDVERLLEIKMRRITKHDSDKADEKIVSLQDEIEKVNFHLDNLTEFAIDYYKRLKEKYGEGKERKTEIKSFDNIDRKTVAVANTKLYVNRKEGFAGTKLKRTESEFVCDCSDIDDLIVIRKDGTMSVSRISEKAFFGKDIIHIAVWKKGDERTTYNLIYQDGPRGNYYVKRFNVKSITRDKEYPLTAGSKGSKIIYFTANPNGEAEIVKVILRPKPKLKRVKFDFDFTDLAIKGRTSKGNILSKNIIHKIELKEKGASTLAARKIWWDETVQRLNSDGRGVLLGDFGADDKILTIHKEGYYLLSPYALTTKFSDDYLIMTKFVPEMIASVVYFDGEKEQYTVKRFEIEPTDKKVIFITEHDSSSLELISIDESPKIILHYDKRSNDRPDEEIELNEFIAIKGLKATGNRLTTLKIKSIDLIESGKRTGNDPLKNKPQQESENEDSSNKSLIQSDKNLQEVKTEIKLNTASKEEKPKEEPKKNSIFIKPTDAEKFLDSKAKPTEKEKPQDFEVKKDSVQDKESRTDKKAEKKEIKITPSKRDVVEVTTDEEVAFELDVKNVEAPKPIIKPSSKPKPKPKSKKTPPKSDDTSNQITLEL